MRYKKLVFVIPSLVFLAVSCNKQVSPPPLSKTVSVANIYTNSKQNYKITLPDGYSATEDQQDGALIMISPQPVPTKYNYANYAVSISSPSNKTFEDYVTRRFKIIQTLDSSAIRKDISINEYSAVQLSNQNGTCFPSDSEEIPCKGITTLWQYQGKFYEVSGTAFGPADYPSFVTAYNRLVNSFEYIK